MANGYIQLRIAKTTAYNGRVYVEGEELTVEAIKANRLVERHLAEVIGEEVEIDADNELDGMNLDELKEYAQEAGISLKGLSKKADIIAAIKEAM